MTMRRVLAFGLAGHACLLAASLRHNFVWGEGRSVLGAPLPDVLGAAEGLALLLFALLAGIPYARAARGGATLRVDEVRRCGLLLALAAVLVPPFLSTDIFDNLARGRVEAFHGANPYTMPPAQFPEDPFTRAADWTRFGNPYGPVSSLVQRGVAHLAGDSVWLGVYLFKLLFALCHLATAHCVYLAAARLRPERAPLACYLYLCNPWILLETAGSAHNDALLALGLAAAVAALAARRTATATVALGLAVLAKHSAAVLGPLLLGLAWRQRELARLAVGVVILAGATALLAWHYFLEPGAVDALVAQAGHQRTSLQRFAALLIGAEHGPALTVAGYALAALFLLWRLPAVRDPDSFGREGARVVVFFVVFGMPMFSPWYHLWWLPLVGACAWSHWPRAFAWLAVLGPLSYAVFAVTRELGLAHQVWMWALGLVPVAALVLLRSGREPPPAAP